MVVPTKRDFFENGFPRQCEHWLGMTWFFDSLENPLGICRAGFCCIDLMSLPQGHIPAGKILPQQDQVLTIDFAVAVAVGGSACNRHIPARKNVAVHMVGRSFRICGRHEDIAVVAGVGLQLRAVPITERYRVIGVGQGIGRGIGGFPQKARCSGKNRQTKTPASGNRPSGVSKIFLFFQRTPHFIFSA